MSSRYTKQFFPITELKTKFIRRWKVPCALVKPNARRFHSYKLFSTIKAVFSLELSSISICQYPDAKSSVEKYRWPWSMSKTSLILGNGNESVFVIYLISDNPCKALSPRSSSLLILRVPPMGKLTVL